MMGKHGNKAIENALVDANMDIEYVNSDSQKEGNIYRRSDTCAVHFGIVHPQLLLLVEGIGSSNHDLEVLCDVDTVIRASPLTSIGGKLTTSHSLREQRAFDIGDRRWVWTTNSRVDRRCALEEDVPGLAAVAVCAVVGASLRVVGWKQIVCHEVGVLLHSGV